MRTPGEQQEFLEHGRFREKTIPSWARIGCTSVAAVGLSAVLTAIGLSFLGRHVTKTVAIDQRAVSSSGPLQPVYGYSVETYRWNTEGFRVRFRADDRFVDARLDFPTLVLAGIRQQSWLAGDRAVLLGLEYEQTGDSLHNRSEMWVLYDFGRGDLRTCGLQRVGLSQESSCDELRSFAAGLK